ncbi:MAG: hypothetical protein EOO16_15540 [Chitinophagaceae bacterium]|nr:MAG: hypothetical protein EOO16_15540 [Chitinophagaceae bacterium]
MCRTYNTIGSLTTIKSHLQKNNIPGFKSLRDIIDFQSNYAALRQELISHHEKLIEQEKARLNLELPQLEEAIEKQRLQSKQKLTDELNELKQQLCSSESKTPANFIQQLRKGFRQRDFKRKIKRKEDDFDLEMAIAIGELADDYRFKCNRYQFISSQVDAAVRQSAQHHLSELERKKATIDELNPYIYGALGEHKVAKTLESLPDEYFLINDFAISFSPAIHNRKENDYIKSVQIDHILVGPSGVFLIETKNWSEKSLESWSLRSPVEQIKRTNFVLFRLLNNEKSNGYLRLSGHHWGDKKIPVRNLVVFTKTKPIEEFQHAKILTVNELLGYINYFKPLFSGSEMQRIADFLAEVNSQKTIANHRRRV